MNKIVCAFCCCMLALGSALAVEITGTVPVNVTADTAAVAKDKAFNSARREVIARELRNYANPEQLNAALADSSNDELMNIISSSSLDGERVSDTTYTANISFVIDGDAAKTWMEKYSVQNWLPSSTSGAVIVPENSVIAVATLYNPLSDWAALNAVMRSVELDITTNNIIGSRVSFVVSDSGVAKLSGALRANGWRVVRDVDGIKISR